MSQPQRGSIIEPEGSSASIIPDRPKARKRILVVANPVAGSGIARRLRPLIHELETLGCSVTLHRTCARGDAERFIAASDCHRFDAIAAAGGDGTLNEVLNGMPEGAPPLAVLPLGTANVLAKEIGLRRSIAAMADAAVFGPSRAITVGEANGRRFVVMASVGLDAEVVDNLNLGLKRHIGKGAYLYETLKQMAVSRPAVFRLRSNGEEREAHGVIVANGRCYAGRYIAAPNADLAKPTFEICSLLNPGRLAPPRYLASLALGRFAERADIAIEETSELEILGPPGAPLQADGDVLCRLPATLRVLPGAAHLIYPRVFSI